jgi:hypothetical protein
VVPTGKHKCPTLIIGAEHLFPATSRLNRCSTAAGIELLQHSMHKQFAASAAFGRDTDRFTTNSIAVDTTLCPTMKKPVDQTSTGSLP